MPAVSLYPDVPPFHRFMLPVSNGHVLHVEQWGSSSGLPALVLHGGPGSGCSPLLRRFFDPARYHVVCVDQRGAGRSRPAGGIVHNTTGHLVADLAQLRRHLRWPRWLVAGGSWGATLALAYAAAEPQAVAALLLRAVFLARPQDITGFFDGGERAAAWAPLRALLPGGAALPAAGLPAALAQAFDAARESDGDHVRALALAWRQAESRLAGEAPGEAPEGAALDALVQRYRVQSHYLRAGCWLQSPPLLARCAGVPAVPTLLLHGTEDRVCPPEGAAALHAALPQAALHWVAGAGHDPTHPAMVSAMVGALDRYATHGALDITGGPV
ncbi:alpha/beta fold hydrolase [Aquincola sp. MAHUQ-54]|uniref:Proline iminopeptidase n=1 Tax=Aquincola agrisoli TaxID=3119538 RepID=A0AAW9Q0V4_9BURK